MSRVLVSLSHKSLCARIVFFLSFLFLVILLVSLCLLTRLSFTDCQPPDLLGRVFLFGNGSRKKKSSHADKEYPDLHILVAL